MITQVDGKARVERLEALTKILTFHQGNMFTPCSLVSVILTIEKELVNWATWFSQKL